MKKTLAMLMGGVSILLACKKNTNSGPSFEKITYQLIEDSQNKMSETEIVGYYSQTKEMALKVGTVIFYRTNQGTLGKLKINGVLEDGVLFFEYVNYTANGKPIGNPAAVQVGANKSVDLDDGELDNLASSDLAWVPSQFNYNIQPRQSAVFYVYK